MKTILALILTLLFSSQFTMASDGVHSIKLNTYSTEYTCEKIVTPLVEDLLENEIVSDMKCETSITQNIWRTGQIKISYRINPDFKLCNNDYYKIVYHKNNSKYDVLLKLALSLEHIGIKVIMEGKTKSTNHPGAVLEENTVVAIGIPMVCSLND